MSAPQITLKVPKSMHFRHIFLLGLVKQFFFTEKPKKQALCISMAEPPLPLTVSLTVKYPFSRPSLPWAINRFGKKRRFHISTFYCTALYQTQNRGKSVFRHACTCIYTHLYANTWHGPLGLKFRLFFAVFVELVLLSNKSANCWCSRINCLNICQLYEKQFPSSP